MISRARVHARARKAVSVRSIIEERVLVLRSIAMTFSILLDFVEPDLKGEEKRYKSNNV
jgi:hypothetical protein